VIFLIRPARYQRTAFLAVLCSFGCSLPWSKEQEPTLARVGEQLLLRSELQEVVPIGLTPQDSAAMAQEYVRTWCMEQVLLAKAEENLADTEKDFENRLRDYRNSLVLYAYEQRLIDQKLDTVVRNDDVRAYYEAHADNFVLKDDFLRTRWFKVPMSSSSDMRKVESWWRSTSTEQAHDLEVWLARQGIGFEGNSEGWTSLTNVSAQVPIPVVGAADLLRAQKILVKDSTHAYFLDVIEHRAKGTVSPLELAAADIRAILLDQRKVKLVQDMHEGLYQQALATKQVEIY
jgi:hypothetical protein